jgi:rubrerythrin
MAKLPPPRDPIEALGEAYELLLEKTIEEARKVRDKGGPLLHKIIDQTSENLSALGELSEEQASKVSAYLKRDLEQAAGYMQKTGEDFKKWLAIDTAIVENYLFDRFREAADQTRIELARFKQTAENAEYHSGEVTGPGILICDGCGEQLHFEKAGHIPPCPKCKHSHFHRLHCV